MELLREFLKKEKIKTTIISSIMIILGLLFCVLPNGSLLVLEIITSVLLILWGAFILLGYTFSPLEFRDPLSFFEGLVYLVLGILIDFFPVIFVFLAGLVLILFGVNQINHARSNKITNQKNWWIELVTGITILILGIICAVFCWTNIATKIVSIILGVTLILSGVSSLIFIFVLKREYKKFKKILEKDTEDKLKTNFEKEQTESVDFEDYEVKK